MAFYMLLLRDLPDFKTLEDYRPALTTTVFDRAGHPIGEFYEQRRRLTPLDEVPRRVIQAFLAAEDSGFYEHGGVDYRGILRAAWANLRAGGETVQGASTITQQTVKQLLLSPERTYRRKIRELILANRIEKRFSKDEILYLYLNQTYFGSGAYGIGEAARTYFGKAVADLSVGEAAMLAGLPKAPSRDSPFSNPERAETRRRYVLSRMHEEGYIDDDTYQQAVSTAPTLVPANHEDFRVARYFTEEVRRTLVEALGNDAVLRGGLRVETPLDLDLQRHAVAAVQDGLRRLDHRRGWRGPLRHVAAGDLASELDRIGRANGLIAEPDGANDGAEAPGAEAPPATPPSAQPAPPALTGNGPFVGVVVKVETKQGRARVAFGPDTEADLLLEDVRWAHEVDPTKRQKPLTRIDQAVSVGDVARFEVSADTSPGDDLAPPGLRARLFQEPEAQGALLSYDYHSGDLLALVGGYDFEKSEFNRATQARRQPGSAFKPVIYATAIHHGFTPAHIIFDRPVVYEDKASGFVWKPENYGHRFYGPLTMIEALARSVNNAAIQLLREVGVDPVMAFAKRIGIQSPLERNLGIALGQNPVTLLEMTRAYAVFASGGYLVQPRLITRVLDRQGRVLLENVPLGGLRSQAEAAQRTGTDPQPSAKNPAGKPAEPASGKGSEAAPGLAEGQVIPATEAYLDASLLRDVVQLPHGTGRRARTLRAPLGGKTGTTNDQGDAWFVGFSPDVTTGVWVGFDEKNVLGRGETGGRAALPIWIDFMRAALAGRRQHDFEAPPGIVFARIDAKTGLLASPDTKTPLFQPFLEGTAPTEREDAAVTAEKSRRRLRLDF